MNLQEEKFDLNRHNQRASNNGPVSGCLIVVITFIFLLIYMVNNFLFLE